MNEQELKKKLAEWAEFKQVHSGKSSYWIRPDGYVQDWNEPLPNFPQSLDACFKWLVPEAIDKIMTEQGCSSDVAYGILFKKWLQELELIIPRAALALCLAIEKLR